MSENLHTIIHHVDFFPLRIRVFRNGDMFDQGRILVVTRKQFKHWIVFLDALTALLRTATAVRRLFTIQGIPIHHFDELETNGEYVAVESGPYISVPYGQTRFTLRGKRYNPIIRVSQIVPTFLNSAESMDIYLKKEGYGTITGLPYPFDGILTRSPSASNIQIKHLQSHIPPLKIGGSMEHLNELGTASWLGKNEKWMMGERVKVEPKGTDKEEVLSSEMKETEGSTASEKQKSTTKLPRLLNSNRSFKRETPAHKSTAVSEEVRNICENLPPIDLKGITSNEQNEVKQKNDSDTISIKTEEEVISILKPEKATTESIVSSKVSRNMAPADDEVRYHRSYQVTETTFRTSGKGAEEPEKETEKASEKEITEMGQGKKSEKKERAKWTDGALRRDKSVETKKNGAAEQKKKKEDIGKIEEKSTRKAEEVVEQKDRRKEATKGELRQLDVDINDIPIRSDVTNPIGNTSKIVTSRSSMHLFVDEFVAEDELDDVIGRAALWDQNRRRQKMRQQCTQTSGSLRSVSAPRRRVQLFDPDFD
ncbi:unnamed protein product [Caenorhabditis sp. 36 PRJEB53466]|nr:unnamed protein product [Caenorhabditis sp. 36 PRJEB53466]